MVTHVEVTLKIENRSSLEPLRIDEPRGGDDGLRELLTRPMPIYDNIESELLREQLVGTSAESPAEAFVKRLLNPSPASQSKTEELLRERFAAAEARAAAELAAAESRATAAEEGLASFKESATSAESRAASASAEASLAASTTRVKDSALENEDLREQLAASEAAVAALHASSSFEVPTTKGAVQHRRLEGEIDAASKVDAKGVAHRRRLSFWWPWPPTSCVQIFRNCYDPAWTTSLRAPPAFPTPGAARDTASAS